MNLALDRYADNPVIDELVFWPPKSSRILSVRACCVLFRKPFIEVQMQDGELFQRHFSRDSFASDWAAAIVILQAVSRIRLISDFSFEPLQQPGKLLREVLDCRRECIEECEPMFEAGMYEQFLMQFGEDCKDLPTDTLQKIELARQHLELS